MIETMQKFLESEGGRIAVIITMLALLLVITMVLYMSGHDPAETGRTLLSDAFTSLMTLLLAKLGAKP